MLTGANEMARAAWRTSARSAALTAAAVADEAVTPLMPQAAIAARTPDHVLPLADLRELLMQLDALHAATH